MKTPAIFLFFAAAVFTPCSQTFAEGDCPRGQEVCSSPAKENLGFLTALQTAQEPAAPPAKALSPVPQAPAAPASRAELSKASAENPAGGFSKPGWLLAVGAGLAALYYYLRDGARKRKKR